MALVRPQVVPLSHEGIQRIFAMAYSMPLWLKSRLIFWRDLESFQPVAGSRTNCKCLICFLRRVLAKTATLVILINTKIAGQWLPREDATLGFDPSPTTPQESNTRTSSFTFGRVSGSQRGVHQHPVQSCFPSSAVPPC